MAEIFPDEGLDLILTIFPKGGTNLSTTYLALFTSFTATSVGSSSQTADSYTESDFGSYARVAVAAADWGSISAGTGGRKLSAAQKTFPVATSNGSAAINGYWLANQSSASGDKCIFAANFDDGATSISTDDVIRVTAQMQMNN